MICLGTREAFNATDNHQVLWAYLANAKDPVSDEEFLHFWNSLSEVEKEYYLQTHLPMLFYATKDV